MRIPLLLFVMCWPPGPVTAQDTLALARATRLRVTAVRPLARVETGTYHALTDTSLVLSRGGSRITFPLADISRLEASRGRKLSVAGGVVGFLLGAGAGGVLACAANRDDYGVFCGGQDDTKLVLGAAAGGAVGAALGAVLFRRERWKTLDLGQVRAVPD